MIVGRSRREHEAGHSGSRKHAVRTLFRRGFHTSSQQCAWDLVRTSSGGNLAGRFSFALVPYWMPALAPGLPEMRENLRNERGMDKSTIIAKHREHEG